MFQQRKNKRFSYQPRFQDSEEKESKYDFEAKWNKVNGKEKKGRKFLFSLPALIILLALIFVLIYVLEGYVK